MHDEVREVMTERQRGPFSGAALVTGGGSGLGAATAALLASQGVPVAIVDVREPVDPAVVGFPFYQADVSDPDAVNAAFAAAAQEVGPLAHLACFAGIPPVRMPTVDIEPEAWPRLLAVHVDGTFFSCQAFMRLGPPASASVVTVGSVAGLVGHPERPAYVAAKGALAALTRSLAVEWAPHGVRVNCVHPGFVMTPMVAANIAAGFMVDDPAAHTPQNRLGEPAEIAEAVVFLLSNRASFITGQGLIADGGYVVKKLG